MPTQICEFSRKVNQGLPDGKTNEYIYGQSRDLVIFAKQYFLSVMDQRLLFPIFPSSKRLILLQLSYTYSTIMHLILRRQTPCFLVCRWLEH